MTPSIYLILRIIYLLCFLSHDRTSHQTLCHSGHFDPNLLGRSDPSHSDNSDHFYPLLGSVSCGHCFGFQEEQEEQLFRSRCVGSSWNPGFPSGTPAQHEMELKVDFSNIRDGIGCSWSPNCQQTKTKDSATKEIELDRHHHSPPVASSSGSSGLPPCSSSPVTSFFILQIFCLNS